MEYEIISEFYTNFNRVLKNRLKKGWSISGQLTSATDKSGVKHSILLERKLKDKITESDKSN